MPSGLISTSCGSVSASKMAAASLGKGSAERPWKERVQSIFSSGAVSSSRGLSERPVLLMESVVGRLGVWGGIRGGCVVVFGVVLLVLLVVFCGRVKLELIARLGMGVLSL